MTQIRVTIAALWVVLSAGAASAQTCAEPVMLPPFTQVSPPGGSTVLLDILIPFTALGCQWSVTTDVPWITFIATSGTMSVGHQPANVFYTLAPNAGPSPVHGTITVMEGGNVIQRYPVIVTSNSCSYNVNPPSAQLGQMGGSGQFTVNASPPDCLPYDPASTNVFFALTSSSRAWYDHGIFYYSLPPNGGAPISATATLAPGATFNLTQDAGDGSLQGACPPSGLPLRVATSINGNVEWNCVAAGGKPPYYWSLVSGALPAGLTVNLLGNLFGTPTAEGPFSFVMKVTDSSTPPQSKNFTVSGVVLPSDVYMNCSQYAGPQEVGVSYFNSCMPTGGNGTYQWSISAGALPAGLSLSPGPSGGIIVSGTPTNATPYYYVLQVSDSSTPLPFTAASAFGGTPLSAPPPLSMNCAAPPSAIYVPPSPIYTGDNKIFFLCNSLGGLGNHVYSISSGSLPPGLKTTPLNAEPLYISGTPTVAGKFTFTISVSDSFVPPQAVSQAIDMTILQGLTLTCNPATGPTLVGQAYSSTCTAIGGQPPYTITSGSLPPGLTFVQTSPNTGVISGTPTTANYYFFTPTVVDSAQHAYSLNISGTIGLPTAPQNLTLSCNVTVITSAEVGNAIPPVQCSLSGGTPPYTWQPVGSLYGLSLTIAGNTASLSGIPTSSGILPGLNVWDSSSPQRQFASWNGFSISPRLSMTCSTPSGPVSVGQLYSNSCTATGGVQPIAWSASGNVPLGVTVSSGVMQGAPTTPGPYSFTLTVSDGASPPVTASQTFSGNIQSVGAALVVNCSASTGKYLGGSPITPTTCTASGGTPPYQWSISNGTLPLGLQLASVAAGMAVSGIPTVAGNYTYSIAVSDSSGQRAQWPFSAVVTNPHTYTGNPAVLPHLAFGAGWQSRIVLSAGSSIAEFYGDSGNPLGVPYTDGAGTSSTASYFSPTQSRGFAFLDTTSAVTDSLTTGSAQLFGLYGAPAAYGVFSYPALNWQAVVPLDTTHDDSYVVAFDNTGSLATGVALASTDANSVSVTAVVSDDSGKFLQTASIPLASFAHTSFMLNQQFPISVGKRGTVRFTTPDFGSIHVLAIRTNGPSLTTLPVIAANSAPGSSIAHVTYDGGFTSTFYLVNSGTTSGSFILNFFDESGGSLNVPLLLPQSGATTTTSSLTETLAPGAMVIAQTQPNSALAGISGSAQLRITGGTVNGFEIFQWTTYGQEASVPLELPSSSSGAPRTLVFDNTDGYTTGVAVAVPNNGGAAITVNIRDEDGNLLQTSSISLPGNGHTSFMLPTNYPVTNGIRGSVEFSSEFSQPSVIGIRAGPGGTLTTIPAL